MVNPMRPDIYLSEQDYACIRQAMRDAPLGDGRRLLAREIARARLLPPNRLSRDSVRLNSRVTFLDNEELEIESVRVVLPEAARSPADASVTSLLGAALIGLQVGDTMRWRDRAQERAVTLTRVEPPPA